MRVKLGNIWIIVNISIYFPPKASAVSSIIWAYSWILWDILLERIDLILWRWGSKKNMHMYYYLLSENNKLIQSQISPDKTARCRRRRPLLLHKGSSSLLRALATYSDAPPSPSIANNVSLLLETDPIYLPVPKCSGLILILCFIYGRIISWHILPWYMLLVEGSSLYFETE